MKKQFGFITCIILGICSCEKTDSQNATGLSVEASRADKALSYCDKNNEYVTAEKEDGTLVFTNGCDEFPLFRFNKDSLPQLSSRAITDAERTLNSLYSSEPSGSSSAPPSWSLMADQTPIRNQGSWLRCYIAAGISALEASYKRKYNLDLELSLGYAADVIGMSILNEGYPDDPTWEYRSIFFNYTGSARDVPMRGKFINFVEERFAPTMSLYSARRIVKDYFGIVSDQFFDSKLTTEQIDRVEFETQHIPDAARIHALYAVTSSRYIQGGDGVTDRLEAAISSNHEVAMCMTWDIKYNSSTAVWEQNDPASSSPGGHCLLVVAYDRNAGYFTLKNSWGTGAATNLQWMNVSYGAIKDLYYEGYVIEDVPAPRQQLSSELIGEWATDFDSRLVIRRFGNLRSDYESLCVGSSCWTDIGSYYDSQGVHEVEGYQSSDGILNMRIGPANQVLVPGSDPGGATWMVSTWNDGSGLPAAIITKNGESMHVSSAERYGGKYAAEIAVITLF